MRVYVDRVIDGDTIEASFLKSILGVNVRATAHFRLFGIDAPEVRGETKDAGLAAKAFLMSLIAGQKVKLKIHGKDKYGRWLATVYHNGANVNDLLVLEGHAIYRTY